jgi:hypothetical protein
MSQYAIRPLVHIEQRSDSAYGGTIGPFLVHGNVGMDNVIRSFSFSNIIVEGG